jgi:hypothetical protein
MYRRYPHQTFPMMVYKVTILANQATLPAASNGAGNDDTMLVDNDAQDHTDEKKQANSNEESDTETEVEDDDDKSSSSGLQNLQRGLGVTGMVK